MTNDKSADLVSRFREWDHCWPARWLEGAVSEAADTITALIAENERLREALTKINVGDGWAAQIARATLRKLKGEE